MSIDLYLTISDSDLSFKHLLLITPPGAHCTVNRADHIRADLQYAILLAYVDRQRVSSLLHPKVKFAEFFFSRAKKKLYLTNSRLTRCIGRGKAEADPAPNFHMLWRVFPYMFTQVRARVKKI